MDAEREQELADALRNLADMLNSQSSAMKSAANATTNQTKATEKQTYNTNAQSKASEFSAMANEKLARSSENLNSIFMKTGQSLGGFVSALNSSQEGMHKYSGAVKTAGSALGDFVKGIPIIGEMLKAVIDLAAVATNSVLQTHDNMIMLSRETTKFAGVIPGTVRNFADMSAAAGYAGDKMAKLSRITESVGPGLASLDITAGKGALKFTELATETEAYYRTFSKLGISQESFTEMQGMYLKQQIQNGIASKKSVEELRIESGKYAENLVKMSSITGETVANLQKERDVVKSQYEEKVRTQADELRAQQLVSEGRNEEAAALRANTANRTAILNKLSDTEGAEYAAKAGRLLRTGTYDKLSSSIAISGEGTALLNELREMNAGRKSTEQGAINASDAARKAFDTQTDRFATVLQFSGTELGNRIGQEDSRLNKRMQQGVGKSMLEADKDAANAMVAKLDLVDKNAAIRQDQETIERSFQVKTQRLLLDASAGLSALVMGTKALDKAFGALEGGVRRLLGQDIGSTDSIPDSQKSYRSGGTSPSADMSNADRIASSRARRRAMAGVGGYQPGNPASSHAQQLLDFIGHYEGNSDYRTLVGGKIKEDLTDMTVDQVRAFQKTMTKRKGYASHAVGKYQITGGTLNELIRRGVAKGSDKFDAATQEKYGMALLRGRGYDEYMAGSKSLEAFSAGLRQEWAILPDIHGKSAHEGIAGNKANPKIYNEFMNRLRKPGASMKGNKPVTPQDPNGQLSNQAAAAISPNTPPAPKKIADDSPASDKNSVQLAMMTDILADKMDKLINVTEIGNNTSSKILQSVRV